MASSDSAALAAHNDKWCRSTEKGTAQFREDGGTEVERTGAPRRRRRRAPAACRWWCGPWQAAPWCARGDAAAEKRKRKVETGTWGEVRVVKIDTLQTLIVSCSRERKKSSRSSEEASPRFYLLLKRDLIITVLLLLSLLNRDLIIITGDHNCVIVIVKTWSDHYNGWQTKQRFLERGDGRRDSRRENDTLKRQLWWENDKKNLVWLVDGSEKFLNVKGKENWAGEFSLSSPCCLCLLLVPDLSDHWWWPPIIEEVVFKSAGFRWCWQSLKMTMTITMLLTISLKDNDNPNVVDNLWKWQ